MTWEENQVESLAVYNCTSNAHFTCWTSVHCVLMWCSGSWLMCQKHVICKIIRILQKFSRHRHVLSVMSVKFSNNFSPSWKWIHVFFYFTIHIFAPLVLLVVFLSRLSLVALSVLTGFHTNLIIFEQINSHTICILVYDFIFQYLGATDVDAWIHVIVSVFVRPSVWPVLTNRPWLSL